MKNSSASWAVEQIRKLTGQSVREKDLYLTARGLFTTYRLRLEVVESGHLINLVRAPSSYLFAHIAAASAVLFAGVLFAVATKDDLTGAIGASVSGAIAAGCFYWHTRYVNDRAARENPVLSYSSRSKRLSIPSKDVVLEPEDLGVFLGISGIYYNAHKPESSRAELKLVFNNDGHADWIVLATHFNGWLKKFDPQIIPFAEATGIPWLHVDRNIGSGKFTVDRVT